MSQKKKQDSTKWQEVNTPDATYVSRAARKRVRARDTRGHGTVKKRPPSEQIRIIFSPGLYLCHTSQTVCLSDRHAKHRGNCDLTTARSTPSAECC
ncbi:hypothetical protein GN956_G15770 [Arapaima gigas]